MNSASYVKQQSSKIGISWINPTIGALRSKSTITIDPPQYSGTPELASIASLEFTRDS
ncbi:MAG: hypothetical protein HY693_02720 [Deltaproteobacteria bacterium]|nr:hypothetical protein [Deltaproteobacteria bacterium]